jgi:hypothetical protein
MMKKGAQSSERSFPVLLSHRPRSEALACPRTVPWSLLAPHEERARRNHDQSLERLAERGGLDPSEIAAIVEDRKWMSLELPEAIDRLKALVRDYETRSSG